MPLKLRPELDVSARENARSQALMDRVRHGEREKLAGRPDPLDAELEQQQRPEEGTILHALLQIREGRSNRLPPTAGDWLALDAALDAAELSIAKYDPAVAVFLRTAAEVQSALDRVTAALDNVGASPALATIGSPQTGQSLNDPRTRQPVDLLREYRVMLARVLRGIDYNAMLASAKSETVGV